MNLPELRQLHPNQSPGAGEGKGGEGGSLNPRLDDVG
jgi:hypothetical protein